MNIQFIQSFGSSRNTAGKRPVGASLRRLSGGYDADVVQLSASRSERKKPKEKTIPVWPSDAEIKSEQEALIQKLRKEYAEREKQLYKTYVNDEVRQAILDGNMREASLRKIVSQLHHNPKFIGELFLEPDGGDVMLALPDRIFKNVLKHLPEPKYFKKFALTKDNQGKTFIEKASASKIKIFNEQAYKYPEILKEVYLTENRFGQIPAHYIPPEALDSMNIALSRYPEVIRKIYTSTDINGNTPAHARFYYGQAVIAHILAKDIPTARIMYNTRNIRGEISETALRWAENYRGPYTRTWNYILQNF